MLLSSRCCTASQVVHERTCRQQKLYCNDDVCGISSLSIWCLLCSDELSRNDFTCCPLSMVSTKRSPQVTDTAAAPASYRCPPGTLSNLQDAFQVMLQYLLGGHDSGIVNFLLSPSDAVSVGFQFCGAWVAYSICMHALCTTTSRNSLLIVLR